ncbi:hypothetical protein DPMN_045806 [Dreissena polymorpha]|uniref:Uncharacterized protein n=1 Tax=Dreissena polymorpha TaxID=45954 RepID=A0A9D4D6Z9_DREPO|nr:hypothetical protein DPMN_045806 [Dreissena polymorpha]
MHNRHQVKTTLHLDYRLDLNLTRSKQNGRDTVDLTRTSGTTASKGASASTSPHLTKWR